MSMAVRRKSLMWVPTRQYAQQYWHSNGESGRSLADEERVRQLSPKPTTPTLLDGIRRINMRQRKTEAKKELKILEKKPVYK